MLRDIFEKRALGLEFRDGSVVITCLRKGLSGIEFVSSTTVPFDASADENAISDLKNFLATHGAGADTVFVAIPSSWALAKFLDIPSLERDDLGRLMGYEAEKHVPFGLDEVYYDFHVLGRNGNTYKTVLVAVQREKVEYLKELLLKVQLQPESINISSLCALNAIGSNGQRPEIRNFSSVEDQSVVFGNRGEVCVLLLMGRNGCEMSVISGGRCIYLKNIRLDVESPSEIIWNSLSGEIEATLSWLSIQKFDRLVLAGRGSSAVAGHAIKIPNLKVTVAKRPEGTSASTGTPDNELLPSIGACLSGLGIGDININVLPGKRKVNKTGRMVSVASLCIVFLLLGGLVVSGLINDKRHLRMIEENIRKNAPEMADAEKSATRLEIAENQMWLLLSARYKSVSQLEMLSELSSIIPADTWLMHLKYKEDGSAEGGAGGELVIQGFAGSSSKLILLLEDSPLFENVEFDGPINKSELGEGFKIRAMVRNDD